MDSVANDYSEKYRAIGSNIRMVRNAAGISQTELANCVGSDKSAISRYENGTQRPKLETLMRIADALGVDLVDLLKEKATLQLGKVVSTPDPDWMQVLNIDLTQMSPTARQSFTSSVIAMYRGYQKELSETI